MRHFFYSKQALTECACELITGSVLLYFAASGNYLSYVAPRIRPFLFIGAAALIALGISSIPHIKQIQHRNHTAHCLLLIIPTLLLLLPHGASQAVTATAGLTTVPNAVKGSTTSEQTEKTKLSGLDKTHKKITIQNEEFYQWMVELNENLDKYAGYTITTTGFVFKDSKSIQTGEFVPARLAMTCCTADLTPMGFLCKYPKTSELKENTWVTVEGKLFKGTYQGNPDPQIQVTKVKPAQSVKEYIYPYQ